MAPIGSVFCFIITAEFQEEIYVKCKTICQCLSPSDLYLLLSNPHFLVLFVLCSICTSSPCFLLYFGLSLSSHHTDRHKRWVANSTDSGSTDSSVPPGKTVLRVKPFWLPLILEDAKFPLIYFLRRQILTWWKIICFCWTLTARCNAVHLKICSNFLVYIYFEPLRKHESSPFAGGRFELMNSLWRFNKLTHEDLRSFAANDLLLRRSNFSNLGNWVDRCQCCLWLLALTFIDFLRFLWLFSISFDLQHHSINPAIIYLA